MESPIPRGARVIISGLASRADLNEAEATVLTWLPEKGRLCVQVIGQPGIQIKPDNLTRCANPFAKLDSDCLGAVLRMIDMWQGAARAAASCKSWHAIFSLGTFPLSATAQGQTNRRWTQPKHFGWDWEEAMPFARPPKWATPAANPSWTWALHSFNGVERVPMVLRWLDYMNERWPGVTIVRWPGAGRRLAWLQGAMKGLSMADLFGVLPRKWPPGSNSIMLSSYRDGGSYDKVEQPALPCVVPAFPADAALFFALMPEGFGEVASDGAFEHPFDGIEVLGRPWVDAATLRRTTIARAAAQVGCPARLLNRIAVTGEEHGPVTLCLCCDPNHAHYAELLAVRHINGRRVSTGSGPGQQSVEEDLEAVWTGANFARLLELICEAAEETLATKPECRKQHDASNNTEKERVGGYGRWDIVWQQEHGALVLLLSKLGTAPSLRR